MVRRRIRICLGRIKETIMTKLTYAYLFRRDFDNAGDLHSCPMHYLSGDKHGIMIDVYDNNLPNIEVDVLFIGGGAIFSTKKFVNSIEHILTRVKSKYKIVWGVGLTPALLENNNIQYDLFGVRDFNIPNYTWTPCSSALHASLYKNLTKIPSKKFLVVDHWKRPIEFTLEHTRLNNKPNNINAIIENIVDHEYVFTTSFHVAYWAILLNRKTYVIGENLPGKFHTMKHSPIIVPKFNDELLDQTLIWDNAYEECVEANKNFRHRIKDLIGIEFPFTNTNFN